MSKILLLGSDGSIGKRYQAIIKHLGFEKDLIPFDINHEVTAPYEDQDISFVKYMTEDISKVIIATPTPSHKRIIEAIVEHYKNEMMAQPAILCEKPICTNSREVDELLDKCEDIQMVLQYSFFRWNESDDTVSVGDPILNNLNWGQHESHFSHFNFYNSGNDLLPWDCIQIIGLHTGPLSDENIYIKNSLPLWDVIINNKRLSLDRMQYAYLCQIREWLSGNRLLTKQQIVKMHEKVEDFIGFHNDKSFDRNSGKIDIDPATWEGI